VVSVIIPNLDEVMQMIEKNIFRPLPNVKKSNLGFSETGIDQEEEMDPAWPHLQGIYEFFLQLVINESVEVRSLKVYVTPQFVQEFLELFDSEESVERDYLKNILHKLYAKVSLYLIAGLNFEMLSSDLYRLALNTSSSFSCTNVVESQQIRHLLHFN